MNNLKIIKPDWDVAVYRVSGINPKTNRRKTVEVVVYSFDEEKARSESGLFSVDLIENVTPVPTEAQINYGRDLGILYSDEYSKYDYSCLISVANGEIEYIPTDKRAAEFGRKNGLIYYSHFISLSVLFCDYVRMLSKSQKIVCYVFSVYQAINGFICYDYLDHPKRTLFENIGSTLLNDDAFCRSFCRCDYMEFVPDYKYLRKNSNAYKICCGLLC